MPPQLVHDGQSTLLVDHCNMMKNFKLEMRSPICYGGVQETIKKINFSSYTKIYITYELVKTNIA